MVTGLRTVIGVLSCVLLPGALGCTAPSGDSAHEHSQHAASAIASPVVSIDWSMPDMFGNDFDGDGYIDLVPKTPSDPSLSPVVGAPLRPSAWKVLLDGCSSSPAQSYAWDVSLPSGDQHIEAGSSCSYWTQFPAQGTYYVTLTLGFDDGTTASGSQWVTVKNYLIVSMGDSIASGEGVPDYEAIPSASQPPGWVDTRCHRSANSGHAQAALALERSDPHSSVRFVSVACSGAGIDQGLLNGYVGQQPPPNAKNLPPQITQAVSVVCGLYGVPPGAPPPPPCNPIDAVLLTVGANDAGFGDVVRTCANPVTTCWLDSGFASGIDAKVRGLPSLYDTLNQAIHQALDVKRIYFAEYDDPTHDAEGNSCSEMVLRGAVKDQFALAGDLGLTDGNINQSEVVWAREHVLAPLNQSALGAAQRNGWKYIGGIADAFKTHGYCANDLNAGDPPEPPGGFCRTHPCEHWVDRYDESKSIEFLPDGTMHPNVDGHAAIAKYILAALQEDMTLPRALVSSVPQPTTGDIHVFARGTDDAIYVQHSDGAVWDVWQGLGGAMSSTPSGVWTMADGLGQTEVFAVDKLGQLQQNACDPWGYCGGWVPLGMGTNVAIPPPGGQGAPGTRVLQLAGRPTAVVRADGGMDVFGRGDDGQLWHVSSFYVGGTFQWTSWEQTNAPPYVGDPSIVANGPNRLDVVVGGEEGTLWHGWENLDSGVGDWQWENKGLPGQFSFAAQPIDGNPKLVAWDPTRLDIFALGRDKALWHLWYDATSGGWGSWESKGNVLTSDPEAVSSAPGRLDVFARGPGLDIWKLSLDGSSGWSDWQPTGLPAESGVTADVPWIGTLDIYAQWPGGGVYSDAYQPSGLLYWSWLGGTVY